MNKLAHHLHSLRNRFRKRPAVVRFGGNAHIGLPIDAPKLLDHPSVNAMGSANVRNSIPAAAIMPPMYQQASDCGPCDLAALQYAATGQQLSPRAGYVWSRQLAGTYPNDTGTYATYNIQVATKQGQPRTSVYPYAGDINALPGPAAITDAAAYKLSAALTPDLASVTAAIDAGHPVSIYVAATTDFYYPFACPDGTHEVLTPTALSKSVGGHFIAVIAYDNLRKMQDGTLGGVKILNSWGIGWGDSGTAWLSIAGWFNTNGDAASRFTLLPAAPPPQPLTLTITAPTTQTVIVPKGTEVFFAWTSTGDKVTVTDSLYNSLTNYPANGKFSTRAMGPQIFTFVASLNGVTIAPQTATIAISP